jgi:flagellar assembly protein FliH
MPDSSSRVLKANVARELPTRVAFNFEDLREQAAVHLAEARAEAESLKEQARQEAASIRQKALDEARELGKREGLQHAQQLIEQQAQQLTNQRFNDHLKGTLPALQHAAEALKQERDGWLLRWERAAVELSVAIAEKLLRTELSTRPDLTTQMLTEALQLAAGQTQLKVRFHPADLDRLGPQAQEVIKRLTACADPELIGDPSIASGGCIIDTQHGQIDARLETILERITAELLEN